MPDGRLAALTRAGQPLERVVRRGADDPVGRLSEGKGPARMELASPGPTCYLRTGYGILTLSSRLNRKDSCRTGFLACCTVRGGACERLYSSHRTYIPFCLWPRPDVIRNQGDTPVWPTSGRTATPTHERMEQETTRSYVLRLGMKRSVSPIFGKGRSTPNFWPTLHLLSVQSG